MAKKRDLTAELLIRRLRVKVEENKQYSAEDCYPWIVYVFENEEEYENYFISNGAPIAVNEEILSLCKLTSTRKGTVIAYKVLCDRAIKTSLKGNKTIQEIEMGLKHTILCYSMRRKINQL